ncbi:hypothetical protein ACFQ5N_14185 [Lutibacter holmesii]|uniref:Uncharacterized protein n=1 Tax=Lutibacter holmesii TaxID=1137985 RepID=A0ABW3WRH8_9FLAO
MISLNKKQLVVIIISGGILLIPLIAMQFTDEVNWGFLDFVVAAFLLLSTGFLCEFVVRKIKKTSYQLFLIVLIIIVLLTIWIELATGVFSSL